MTNPNTDRRNMTLIKSFIEEAEDILKWGNWYRRSGNEEAYEKHKKMAQDRYDHAEKLKEKIG